MNSQPVAVSANKFLHNGYHPAGLVDADGVRVADGLHVDQPTSGGDITVTANIADDNAAYGIYAPGVTDGGGNAARGNGHPAQCLGVTCT